MPREIGPFLSADDLEGGGKEIKKEEYGRNVEVSAIFARHAAYDKLPEALGKLSEEGREQAKEFGENLAVSGRVKGYSSGALRTKETLKIVKENIDPPDQYVSRIIPEFTIDISEEQVKEYFGGSLDNYLEDKKTIEVPSEVPLAKEVAGFLAKRLERYIGMSKRLKENSKINLLNFCHTPHLVAFLKEAIGGEVDKEPIKAVSKEANDDMSNLDEKSFFKKIGGKIDPTESFEVAIESGTKDPADTKVALLFRERKFSLSQTDIKRIASYCQEYEKRQQKKVD